MKNKKKKGKKKTSTGIECAEQILTVREALNILSGKWKLPIIIALSYNNSRFKEIQKEVTGITAKMLSHELKELEASELVSRTVLNTVPVSIDYELTEYANTLEKVIKTLDDWGGKHQKRALKKTSRNVTPVVA